MNAIKKSIDPIWEKIHSSQSWGAYPSEHVIRFVARNFYSVEDRKAIKILDFGCGQGSHTWYLSREGFDAFAFDGSESAVKKAEERLSREGLSAKFSVMDGTSLEYESDYFDAVIDSACIYANKMDDITKMYAEVYRVLKPGGKLFTCVFGEKLEGCKSGKEIEKGTFIDIQEGVLVNRGTTHVFTRDELENVLSDSGFGSINCDEINYTDNGHMVHMYFCRAQK